MASLLILTAVEKLQTNINEILKSYKNIPGIYVSLNKTQKSTENILTKAGINLKNIFFIDCISLEKIKNKALHIPPTELDLLSTAIISFIKEIKGKKFLIIDSLGTLLIYNDEKKVAKFVKEITEYASENACEVIALSPKTEEKELLTKIFNFFDKIRKE